MRARTALLTTLGGVALLGLLALLGVARPAPASAAATSSPGTIAWPMGPTASAYTLITAPGAQAITGHFTADHDGVVWYTPGSGGDAWWQAKGDRTFTKLALTITGTYEPIVGDLTGDGVDDIFWWNSKGTDSLWDFNADGTITKRTDVQVDGSAIPVVGAFGAGTKARIFFYGPGTAPDRLLTVTDGGSSQKAFTINGLYTVVPGRFTGTDVNASTQHDLLLYAPGTKADFIWHFRDDGTVAQRSITVNGTYQPIVGDFTYDGADDIIWYGPGTAGDAMWDLNADGSITNVPISIKGTYQPLVCRCRPDMSQLDDVAWFAPGPASDTMWNFASADGIHITRTSVPLILEHDRAVTGADLEGDGQQDLISWS